MAKKMTKILVTFMFILVIFFMKVGSANALGYSGGYMVGDPKDYPYVSPINPFNSNGKPESKRLDVFFNNKQVLFGPYPEYYVLNTSDLTSGKTGTYIGFGYNYLNSIYLFENEASANFWKLVKSNLNNFMTGKNIKKSLAENYAGNTAGIDVNFDKEHIKLVSLTQNSPVSYTFTPQFNENLKNGNLEYVKYENGSFAAATEDEYKEYIINQSKYTRERYDLSNCKDDGSKNKDEFVKLQMDNISKWNYSYLCEYNEAGFTNTSKIVFVSTKRRQYYSGSNYNTLVANMKKYANSDELYTRALQGLSIFLDTSSYDTKTFSKVYYDSTKTKMFSFMLNYMNKGENLSYINDVSKNNFANWFDLTGRYVLEDKQGGVELFKTYFEFIFGDTSSPKDENGDYTQARTSSNVFGVTFSQDEYSLIVKSLNDMLNILDTDNKIQKLVDDPCITYCPSCLKSTNSNECLTCKGKGTNTSYGACSKCRSNANDTCKGKESTTCYTSEFDKCLNSAIGEGASEYLHSSYAEIMSSLEKEMDGQVDDMVDNLNSLIKLFKVATPNPNFDFGTYEANCEDVSILHTIYMIIVISAPILAIVLGSLDYAKAVIAADEKKAQEFKKQFPKRLIALVLLILVPFIIHFILSIFPAAKDTLMYCVINGS